MIRTFFAFIGAMLVIQTPALALGDAGSTPKKDKKVCKMVNVDTASRMPRRVCRSGRDLQPEDKAAQQNGGGKLLRAVTDATNAGGGAAPQR